MFPERKYWRYVLEDWWQNLAIRRWINENPKKAIRLSCASFAILLLIIVWLLWPAKEVKPELPVHMEWFCDLDTGKLSAVPEFSRRGPGQRSGNSAKAVVISYVLEPNVSERIVAFLQKTENTPDGPKLFICTLDDPNWIPVDTPKGRSISQKYFVPNSKGQMPHILLPK